MKFSNNVILAISEGRNYSTNQHGGLYRHGYCYSYETKIKVIHEYKKLKVQTGKRPNITLVARRAKVSRGYVLKVETEFNYFKTVLPTVQNRKSGGAGSYTFDSIDYYYIIFLYNTNNTRTIKNYVSSMFDDMGVIVSKSTVRNVLENSYEYKAKLRSANIVPLDKFRPANIVKAILFKEALSKFQPGRCKYVDEKLIKGEDFFHRNPRRNMCTGVVPPIRSTGDFRNTYSCLGMTSINRNNIIPFLFKIHKEKNDSYEFGEYINLAISSGFLITWDILIADNAAYHFGGINSTLICYLWEYHRILVLFLPARTPEWNPVELIWALMVVRMMAYSTDYAKKFTSDGVAHIAHEVLSAMSFEDVFKTYVHVLNL